MATYNFDLLRLAPIDDDGYEVAAGGLCDSAEMNDQLAWCHVGELIGILSETAVKSKLFITMGRDNSITFSIFGDRIYSCDVVWESFANWTFPGNAMAIAKSIVGEWDRQINDKTCRCLTESVKDCLGDL